MAVVRGDLAECTRRAIFAVLMRCSDDYCEWDKWGDIVSGRRVTLAQTFDSP